jgi:hypothetical protein
VAMVESFWSQDVILTVSGGQVSSRHILAPLL